MLDALPEELAELFRNLETTLLDEICSRLNLADQLNEVTVQAMRTLRSHGISQKEIEQAIRKTTGISEKKLNELLDDVVKRNQQYYTEVIDLAKVTAPETLLDAAVVDAIRAQTLDTFRNITRSMGFLVDNGRTMLEPAKAYQWALDNATLQIQSGAISYNQAIKGSVKQLADSGIKTVEYESGHVDQVDVAIRRATMTGISQICAKYTEQSAEYLGTPYFEISAHIGARDTGVGWQNHKDWQGKVYSIHAGDKYPSIYEVCGLGMVDGLEGANCRHRRFPFVDGVSERTYTNEELAHIDDGHDVDFEGKHYSAYEATQVQRRIERTIRKLKRQQTAYKAAGLTDEEQAVTARIRRLTAEYKAFSKAAGLPLQRERMRVQYPEEITGIKQFSGLGAYQGNIKIVRKFSERQYQVQLDPPQISGVTDHFAKNLALKPDRAALTIESSQSIINNSRLVLYQTDRNTLKFLADNGYVVLSVDGKIVTAVPEKLRKKYRDYLEGK